MALNPPMEVDIRKLKVLGDRARKEFKNIVELSESIKTNGLINPLTVTPKGDDFILVAGERRLRACILAGLKVVKVHIFSDLSELEQKTVELEENIRREGLSWEEEIENYRQIDELKRQLHGEKRYNPEDGWSQEKTAELVGETIGGVSKKIKFAKKLKDRPELKEHIKNLPLTVAMKKVEQFEKAESVQRLVDSGHTKVNTTLVHSSCIEHVKTLSDESVDLLLTDPPFGIDALEAVRGKKRGSVQSYTTTLTESDNLSREAAIDILEQLAPELYRVLKPGAHFYIFNDFEGIATLVNTLEKAGFEIEWPLLIWNKERTTAPFRGYNYTPQAEAILFGIKPPRKRMLAKPASQILNFKPTESEDKIHPFQKPLELLDFLITQSTDRGQVVYDPFAGSAATLLAAKKSGRSGVGCELNEKNWKNAQVSLMSEK